MPQREFMNITKTQYAFRLWSALAIHKQPLPVYIIMKCTTCTNSDKLGRTSPGKVVCHRNKWLCSTIGELLKLPQLPQWRILFTISLTEKCCLHTIQWTLCCTFVRVDMLRTLSNIKRYLNISFSFFCYIDTILLYFFYNLFWRHPR